MSKYSSIVPCMLRRENECDQTLSTPYALSEIMIGVMSLIGNGAVITVFCSDKKLRTTSNLYIISLAFVDFLFGLVGIPFAILVS